MRDQLTVITNLELKNAYPGTHATSNASFLSAAKAKWTESTDYHLGTTVDQIAAQQIGQRDAAAVAGAVDGSAPDRRPVRQRVRVRLSEQPVVVVADDAAAGGGASADGLRAAVRRGRQRGRSARGAAPARESARLGARRHHAAAEDARAGGSHARRAVSRHRARGRAPDPEGRSRARRDQRCRISIGRSACRRRMPITRS